MADDDAAGFEAPIRILSDLHLAHPGSKIAEVSELRPLLEGARTLLFNGDTFEQRKRGLRERAEECRVELEAVCEEFGVRPVYMTGNHDPEISEHHHFDLCGGEVFVTHGDVFYEDVSPWSKLIDDMRRILGEIREEYPHDYRDDLELSLKAAKRISAETRVRRAPKPGRLVKLRTLFAEAWPPHRPAMIIKAFLTSHQLAHATRDKFRPDARFIIHGHTHRALVHESGGKFAINTGAFLAGAKSLGVDIAGGELKVRAIERRGDAFHFGRERGSWQVDA